MNGKTATVEEIKPSYRSFFDDSTAYLVRLDEAALSHWGGSPITHHHFRARDLAPLAAVDIAGPRGALP